MFIELDSADLILRCRISITDTKLEYLEYSARELAALGIPPEDMEEQRWVPATINLTAMDLQGWWEDDSLTEGGGTVLVGAATSFVTDVPYPDFDQAWTGR